MRCIILLMISLIASIGYSQSKVRSILLRSSNSITNELGQITVVITNDYGVITIVDNDLVVPIRYRQDWHKMTEEEKSMAISSYNFRSSSFNNPVSRKLPKDKNKDDSTTDSNTTSEIRVIRLRPIKD